VASEAPPAPWLVLSLDIDGTLEFGEPPGPIPVSTVLAVQQAGVVVGSASDRLPSDQRRLWQNTEVQVSFAVPKHTLSGLLDGFRQHPAIHIGDGIGDRLLARAAGAHFIAVHECSAADWRDIELVKKTLKERIQ
jgi:hypothetical protein